MINVGDIVKVNPNIVGTGAHKYIPQVSNLLALCIKKDYGMSTIAWLPGYKGSKESPYFIEEYDSFNGAAVSDYFLTKVRSKTMLSKNSQAICVVPGLYELDRPEVTVTDISSSFPDKYICRQGIAQRAIDSCHLVNFSDLTIIPSNPRMLNLKNRNVILEE